MNKVSYVYRDKLWDGSQVTINYCHRRRLVRSFGVGVEISFIVSSRSSVLAFCDRMLNELLEMVIRRILPSYVDSRD